ncbi:MAG: hypothetical protein VB141_06670, partial [Burkholderia gladioli]
MTAADDDHVKFSGIKHCGFRVRTYADLREKYGANYSGFAFGPNIGRTAADQQKRGGFKVEVQQKRVEPEGHRPRQRSH